MAKKYPYYIEEEKAKYKFDFDEQITPYFLGNVIYNETVLLVDDDVENKSVPVILCNEDDVAGNHGAAIGHVRPEQMFYLASRGLSQEAAEQMFVRAMLEQAAIDAPDQASREGVLRLATTLVDGFDADFLEEEA